MQLNCSVVKVNPQLTSFVWQYCDLEQSTCDPKNDSTWEQIDADYLNAKLANLTFSLVLEDQPQDKIIYRCKAKNILGSDQISYKIFRMPGNINYILLYFNLSCTVTILSTIYEYNYTPFTRCPGVRKLCRYKKNTVCKCSSFLNFIP